MTARYKNTEEDTKRKYITPALSSRGWKDEQIVMEYTIKADRHVINKNAFSTIKIKQNSRADYVLSYMPNCPIAVIEAKRDELQDSEGLDQAIAYAKALNVQFAYSSAGKKFIEFNLKTGTQTEIPLNCFPTPKELWQRVCDEKNIRGSVAEKLESATYYTSWDKSPRYYQLNAINKTIEAILIENRKRLLIVMATGTGKTYTAFQIVWRLMKAKAVTNVLYLADRNQLVDQTITGDFKPFEKSMTKITKGEINTSYNIFFALYQQLSQTSVDEDDESESTNKDYFNYQKLKRDFFDLIIVDECHRGSAKENSAWRDILTYFEGAIQIGMTATPKVDKEANNINYFGEPIFTYSLKDGIEDGYLASYKVIDHIIDRDELGWEPADGELDDKGRLIPQKIYTLKDFDRKIELQSRIDLVAQKVTEYLKEIGDMSKTIVFCASQRHALKMRDALRKLNSEKMAENSNYIVRMTADDEEGKALYDDFTGIYRDYPVVVTTSKLLTTGADTKCVKLIVLDAPIRSMTEFKQIVGRGTRLVDENNKTFFTVLDFRRVSKMFLDPGFDGPIDVIDESVVCGGRKKEKKGTETEKEPMYEVSQQIDVDVMAKRVSYINNEGKLVPEKFIDYTKAEILKLYGSREDFIEVWNEALDKDEIIRTLEKDYKITVAQLEEAVGAQDIDIFDMICHIAYGEPMVSRHKRAESVRKSGFLSEYKDIAKEILDKILNRYLSDGIAELESPALLKASEFDEYGGMVKIIDSFGGKENYYDALNKLKDHIYMPVEEVEDIAP